MDLLENYTSPPHYRAVRDGIRALKARYPQRLRVFSAGRSVGGRSIPALGLGEVRGAPLFVGGVHASEWLNVLLLLRFVEESLEQGKNDSLTVIPCLNPDGTEIALSGSAAAGGRARFIESVWPDKSRVWQANLRGVDLNHNFDAGWRELRALEQADGVYGPGPGRYGGAAPFSEPESRAAANLCLSLKARSLYAFHSQGEEIYWRYGERTPPDAEAAARRLAASCGYAVAEPTGTASHGGLKDWFIQTTGRYGFTIETGRGRNPLPQRDFPALYERVLPLLALAVSL